MSYGKFCHQGPAKVFTLGKTNVYAGSMQEMHGDFDWKFMLRVMDGGREYPTLVNLNPEAKKLFPKAIVDQANPAIMDIEWGDFDAPILTREWWMLLNDTIRGWKTAGNMAVHCVGGHGRTGTVLSILAGLNNLHKAENYIDPVAFVRAKYCTSVVESSAQIEYIESILQYPIMSKGSFAMGFGAQKTFDQKYPEYANIVGTTVPAIGKPSNGSNLVYAGETVYREREDGFLEEVGPDDGSYYGPNHSAISSASILIPADQVQE